jgi:hypothetical protein
MKTNRTKNGFTGSLEHRGGKKLSQHGVEFSPKKLEVRKHPTGGFPGRKG